MKRSLILSGGLVLALAACGDDDDDITDASSPDASVADAGAPDAALPDAFAGGRLVLLGTSDEHSVIFAYGPEGEDYPIPTTAGDGGKIAGAARRMAIFEAERQAAAAAGVDTLTTSSGDADMGALPQVQFVTKAPDMTLLKALGYDVWAIGNHELEFGPSIFAQAIAAAQAHGGVPQLVQSNIRFSDTNAGDDSLAALYGDWDSDKPIKRFHVITTPHGIRVAFLGVMGCRASDASPLKSPIKFSAEPAEEANFSIVMPKIVADLQPVIDEARAQADVVVLLSHSGIDDEHPELSEDEYIAKNTRGVDVIMAGHIHNIARNRFTHDDLDGHPVTVMGPVYYGQAIARVELDVQPGARATIVEAGTRFIDVDSTVVPTPNETILSKLDEIVEEIEEEFVAPTLSRLLGTAVENNTEVAGDLYFYELGKTSFDVRGLVPSAESNISNLSSDALLAAARREVPGEETVMAVQGGTITRAHILKGQTGTIGFSDLFRMLPLGFDPTDLTEGYPVTRFYLMAAEVRAAFEITASRGLVATEFYLLPAGVKVTFDTNREALNLSDPMNALDPTKGRVTRIAIVDDSETEIGVLFDAALGNPWPLSAGPATLIPVVTNYFVASFADAAGVTLKNATGAPISVDEAILRRDDDSSIKDFEILMTYVKEICDANSGYLPARYDATTVEGTVPRRVICEGALCP